jgi:hypothetical protein
MQPVLVSREPDHFNGRKSFGRVGSWMAELRQFAHNYQILLNSIQSQIMKRPVVAD